MERRGISHLEVILAFVLFIGFLFFAWSFFNPLSSTRLLDSSLNYASKAIIDNSSVDLLIYAVKINGISNANGNQQGNNQINMVIKINIPGVPESMKVSVVNELNEPIEASRDNNKELIHIDNGNDKIKVGSIIYVRFSDDFDEGNVNGGANIDYTIASVKNEKIMSEKRLSELSNNYKASDSELKKKFNLPNRVEFGFKLVFSENSEISAEKEIPKGAEVYSNSKRIEVLRANGEMQFADLIVKVW